MVAVGAIAAIGAVRLVRRARLHRPALVVALLDLLVQLLIVILGLALVFSPGTLVDGLSLAPGQEWLDDLLFAIPLGFLAYTGLETVANLAEEAREPGRTLPRSLFSAIGLVVVLTVLIAVVGVSAFPAEDGTSELGDEWLEAPLVGIVTAFDGSLPSGLVEVLRVAVGLSSGLILLMAITTSISGCARLAHSMGTHGMLPRELGRLERRTLVSRQSIAAIALVAIAFVLAGAAVPDEAQFLASTYSFGVLLAFTLAQLAVIALRRREPDLPPSFPGSARRPSGRRGRARWLLFSGHPSRRPCSCSRWSRTRAPATPALPGSRSGSSSTQGRAGANGEDSSRASTRAPRCPWARRSDGSSSR